MASLTSLTSAAAEHACPAVGSRVAVTHAGQALLGTVRFAGPTQFAAGIWVGVELDEAVGKNDGMIKDVRYFVCAPRHGILVRPSACFDPGLRDSLQEALAKKAQLAGVTPPVVVVTPPAARVATAAPDPVAAPAAATVQFNGDAGSQASQAHGRASVQFNGDVDLEASQATSSRRRRSVDPAKVAEVQLQLAQVVEDHDIEGIRRLLPEARRCGLPIPELEGAQRILFSEVRGSMIQEIEEVRSSVLRLAVSARRKVSVTPEVRKAGSLAKTTRKSQAKKASPRPAPIVSVEQSPTANAGSRNGMASTIHAGNALQERVWQGLDSRLEDIVEATVRKAMVQLTGSTGDLDNDCSRPRPRRRSKDSAETPAGKDDKRKKRPKKKHQTVGSRVLTEKRRATVDDCPRLDAATDTVGALDLTPANSVKRRERLLTVSDRAESLNRRTSSPAMLQSPYDILYRIQNDMAMIFRFFANQETGDLDADGLAALQEAQGPTACLLKGSLRDVMQLLEIDQEEESIDFLSLYEFVHVKLNADVGLVTRWVEKMCRHVSSYSFRNEVREHEERKKFRETQSLKEDIAEKEPETVGRIWGTAMTIAPERAPEQSSYPVYDEIPAALESFLYQAFTFPHIIHDFAMLRRLAGIDAASGPHSFATLRDALAPKLNYKLGAVFRTLDKRINEETSKTKHGLYRKQPLAGTKVIVCGSGPVGLRCSLELRMLGAEVMLLEKRNTFSRHNILHLWDWVMHDLLSLGAKILYPKFGSAASFLHIGTKQLQCMLLKMSLLLGVDIQCESEFLSLIPPTGPESRWNVRVGTQSSDSVEVDLPADAVIDATGPRSVVGRQCGFDFTTVQMAGAVGLVVNFVHTGSREERLLKEFSWARQFNTELFSKLSELGADLENIVYYQGETHYLVMTPKRTNLMDFGALTEVPGANSSSPSQGPLDPSRVQVCKPKLREYVRLVASHFGIPENCGLVEEPALFDFSCRRAAREAMRALKPPDGQGPQLLVAAVGDALMEPFWPEGLGITRGFLGALDACWTMQDLKSCDGDVKELIERQKKTFGALRQLSAFTRGNLLVENAKGFTLDPATRYKGNLLK